MSPQEPHFIILVNGVKLKPMIKAQISGKLVSNDTGDVVIASVHSERTSLKKMNMIIIVNKSQESMALTSARN